MYWEVWLLITPSLLILIRTSSSSLTSKILRSSIGISSPTILRSTITFLISWAKKMQLASRNSVKKESGLMPLQGPPSSQTSYSPGTWQTILMLLHQSTQIAVSQLLVTAPWLKVGVVLTSSQVKPSTFSRLLMEQIWSGVSENMSMSRMIPNHWVTESGIPLMISWSQLVMWPMDKRQSLKMRSTIKMFQAV